MLRSPPTGTGNKEVLLEIFHVLLNVSKVNSPLGVFIMLPTPTQIFESCILSTYQSSNVQFLLFQLSSHDRVSLCTHTHTCIYHIVCQALQQMFLDYLWSKVLFFDTIYLSCLTFAFFSVY